ncbi:MAG: YadA-like family protein [Leptolyngbyaceae cyanobacterium MAG.088]|nr:YadA-like family protein [Leptolyngbyaceae cyanobacterium MAG.088]
MMFNRILYTLGLTAAVLAAAPLTASAQTPGDYNYVGIGGSDEGFVVNGKLSLSENLSVRPAVSTDFDFDGDADVAYVLPITYDFTSLDPNGRLNPFLGAGINGEIGDDSSVEAAVTGGADYRFNDQWLVNGSVVWSPFNNGSDDVDFIAGIGYSF